MTLITSVTVGSGGAASVTLPATGTIPATYTDLYVLLSARSNRSADTDPVNLELNGSTANDTSRYIEGDGSSASSGTAGGTQTEIARIPAANATASTFGNASIYIPNYAGSNNKSSSSDAVTENNGTTAFTKLTAGLWSDSAAVTTIRLVSQTGNSFVEGSTFYLYGISNVTSTTKATGGIVSSDGTYNYHMFPFSGTFTPTTAITVDYLVIAGGGGGASVNGTSDAGNGVGGGGAGGYKTSIGGSALSLTAQAYTVTVGGGGAGTAQNTSARGSSGSNSVFSTITSTGGGGAGSTLSSGVPDGLSGGSGGGGGATGGSAGAASPSGQGNAGGAGGTGSIYVGGGGGGAGTAGIAGNSNGTGGDGLALVSFATATQTGVNNGYYAGGGGGGAYGTANVSFNAAGGLGGGGRGGNGAGNNGLGGAGGNGVTNTGGGGGGGGSGQSTSGQGGKGGDGGSGLVIIRYAI
jgi:hypothetical protein